MIVLKSVAVSSTFLQQKLLLGLIIKWLDFKFLGKTLH